LPGVAAEQAAVELAGMPDLDLAAGESLPPGLAPTKTVGFSSVVRVNLMKDALALSKVDTPTGATLSLLQLGLATLRVESKKDFLAFIKVPMHAP